MGNDLFDVAISSHQVGFCKPDPKIYQVALDRLGISPDEVMNQLERRSADSRA